MNSVRRPAAETSSFSEEEARMGPVSKRVSLVAVAIVLVTLAWPLAGQTPVAVPPAGGQATVQTPPPATPPATPNAPPATPPAMPAPPPDMKALTDANRISDIDKKLEALEAVIKNFPDSPGQRAAHQSLFDTLVKERPAERARILENAQKVIEAAPEELRSPAYSRVATRLVDANILLEDAEQFAQKGLEAFDAEQARQTRRTRATHLATIGRIRIKQGRIAEAETALKDAFAANPEIPSAAIGLAELAEKKNDTQGALGYWSTAALTGRLSAEDRGKFEVLYRKAHNGSLDGLDDMLDAKYKATFTNPVHPAAFKPGPARTNRMVLAEVFTGAGCPPCVSVDLAYDAVLERYPRKDVAVVMYHLHIPAPDPLTNRSTEERAKYYTIRGVPNFAVDGELDNRGGGGRAQTKDSYDRIIGKLDKAVDVAAGADLALEASIQGAMVRVKATPGGLKPDGEQVKLQIALVEQLLSYSGENGVRFHPMVVRSLADAMQGGLTVNRSSLSSTEYYFDLAKISSDIQVYLDDYEVKGRPPNKITFSRKPFKIDPTDLAIVAFLQEEKSKKVLQTAYVKVGGATSSSNGR
jgi:tetratricopeptide (TPR) repeat protein